MSEVLTLAYLVEFAQEHTAERQRLKGQLKRVAHGCVDAKRQAFKDAFKGLFCLGVEQDAVLNALLQRLPEFFSDCAAEVIHQQQANGVADSAPGGVCLADLIWIENLIFHGASSDEVKMAYIRKYFAKRAASVGGACP